MVVLLVVTARAEDIRKMTAGSPLDQQSLETILVNAGMADADAVGMIREMIDAHYTDKQMTSIGQQVQATAEERITQEAVISKIREGMAKRVGAEGIIKATDKVRERYGFAMKTARVLTKEHYTILGGVIADGLTSGLTQQDSEQIINKLQVRSKEMDKDKLQALSAETMITSRDMVRLGVSSQVTLEVVADALERGYDELSMQILRQTLNAQRMQSDMNQVAQRLGLAIQQGVKAKDLGAHAGASGNEASGGKGFGNFGPGGSRGGGTGGGGRGGGR
jgi:hypothetical protein